MVRKCNLSEGDLGCSGHLGWALLGTVPRAQPRCTEPGQFKPWGRGGHDIAHSRSRYAKQSYSLASAIHCIVFLDSFLNTHPLQAS